MTIRNKLKVAVFVLAGLLLFSCKKKVIEPTGITLSPSSLMMNVGRIDTLTVAITPANGSASMVWSSDNTAVAIVDQTGAVKAVGVGSAVITVTTGNGLVTSSMVTTTRWSAYDTTNSGLAGNAIFTIAIDSSGNKWFGTDQGLSRFDGNNWTTYNTANSGLPENKVHSIAIDAADSKWLVTDNNVCKLDGLQWTIYNSSSIGLTGTIFNGIAVDRKGVKWVGGALGASAFNDTTWTNYNPASALGYDFPVYAIAFDIHGNKWFVLAYGGMIWKYDDSNWTPYYMSDSTFLGFENRAVAGDEQGNMWFGFGSNSASISNFDGTRWTSYRYDYTSSSIVPDLGTGVYGIAIDSKGNKWFATAGGGVKKFDGTHWTTYDTTNSGLADNYVFAITADAQDNIWCGTWANGVSVLYAR